MPLKHDNTAYNIDYRDPLGGVVTTGTGNFPTHKDFMQMPVTLPMSISDAPSVVVSGVNVLAISSSDIVGNIALGATSNIKNGGISAASLAGAIGTGDETGVVTDATGNIWNLSRVLDASALTPIFNISNKQVWALTQAKSDAVDGDAIAASGSENLQVTFVVRSGTGFVTQVITDTVKIQFAELHCWNSLPATGIVLQTQSQGDMRFDPPAVGGADIPTFQTTVSLTATQTNNIYSVAASDTGYVTSGDVGDLGVDATDFNTRESKRIELNGVNQLKGTDVIWQTSTTFQFIGTVDSTDTFVAIT